MFPFPKRLQCVVVEELLCKFILLHIVGIDDIQHDKDRKLGGDHVAVVQVPQGRQQHDLITEFFEDPPVFGGQDDRLGAS